MAYTGTVNNALNRMACQMFHSHLTIAFHFLVQVKHTLDNIQVTECKMIRTKAGSLCYSSLFSNDNNIYLTHLSWQTMRAVDFDVESYAGLSKPMEVPFSPSIMN